MYSQSPFRRLPAEVSEQIYSYLPPESARNAASAQLSDVFTSEYNQRYRASSRAISLEDAFYPTLGKVFADLLFYKNLVFSIARVYGTFKTANLTIEYYHAGNHVELKGSLLYDDDLILIPHHIIGYLDDDYRFHISGDKISFLVSTSKDTRVRMLVIQLLEPNVIRIAYDVTITYTIIKTKHYTVVLHENLVTLFGDTELPVFENMPIDQALLNATLKDNIDVVKILLRNGANVNVADDVALRVAATKGYLDVVECLLENNANPYAKDNYALRMAQKNGYTDVADALLHYMKTHPRV